VIGGYLGAGKTTLLNRILKQNDGIRYALLINDFGEINIDAGLIESQTDAQINLTNGCVCCTLVDGFHQAIEQLCELDPPPDHILVEASGVADVSNLAQYGHGPDLSLDGVLVLADAETIQDKANDKYVAATVKRQLAAADVLILNKCDLLENEQLTKQTGWLKSNFPEAIIIMTTHCDVPMAVISGVHRENSSLQVAHQDHESYSTWSFASDQAASSEQLQEFLSRLDDTVLRIKGVSALSPDSVLVVQGVGKRREVSTGVGHQEGIKLVAIGLEGKLDCDQLNTLAAEHLK